MTTINSGLAGDRFESIVNQSDRGTEMKAYWDETKGRMVFDFEGEEVRGDFSAIGGILQNDPEIINGKFINTGAYLKKCPLCGQQPDGPNNADSEWWIECPRCEITMENDSRQALVDAWNARLAS